MKYMKRCGKKRSVKNESGTWNGMGGRGQGYFITMELVMIKDGIYDMLSGRDIGSGKNLR